MKPVELPAAFARFAAMGGALQFSVFDDADGTEAAIAAAIGRSLPHARRFDEAVLRDLGSRPLDARGFFGDWYEAENSLLLKRGRYTTADGRELVDPRLRDLDGVAIKSGGSPLPEAGSGGQFAYAFSFTPYGLQARPSEIQAVFDEIRRFILPPGEAVEIRDWSHPDLPRVSDYFEDGMEWWGVFLFSLYQPARRRLAIVAGSTTD